MRHLWLIVRKDLNRWIRDPVGIALWALIPLAVALLLKLAFGGSPKLQAEVAVVDQDDSLVTNLVIGALGQGQLADLIEPTETDSATAIRLVNGGEVSAALFFEPGFGETYLNGSTARLTLIKNPAEQILPQIVEELVQVLAEGGFYLRELLDEPLDTMVASMQETGPPSESAIATISTSFGRILGDAGGYLFPPVITVGQSVGDESGGLGGIDFMKLFFPGVILMALLFVAQPLAFDLWEEHKNGTFRRSEVSPAGTRGLVLGKVMASTLLLWVIFMILLLVGRFLLRIELQNLVAAATFAAVTGFGFVAGLMNVVTLPKTQNGGTILSSLIIMPLVFIGGSFFPFEAMPPFLRTIGELTPNGRVLTQLKPILHGGADPLAVVMTAAASIALGLLFVLLAGRQCRRRFLGE